MNFKNIIYLFSTSCLLLVTMNVEAIPAFARKTNMACSICHTAWPALNAFGRQYKEHGYRLGHLEPPTKTITKDLKWDENLPVSVILVARPYDKQKTGEYKVRSIHEVELMVGGPMGEKYSSFFEIEAEDEVTNGIGLDTGIPAAVLTMNQSESVNLQFSWGSNTFFDPYNSFSNNRRLTRGTYGVIDQGFGGADNGGKLRSSRQNIAIYGRLASKFFYGVAMSGDAGDAEGVQGNTVTARAAFDVMPSLSIGALVVSGTCAANAGNCLVDREYSRNAIDLQSEVANFTFNAVALAAKDDLTATTTEKNNAYYVQALYTAKDGARTTWAPLLRYDSYEKSGGTEKVDELTASINYYVTENVRSMLEFWSKDSNVNTNDNNRVTIQLFAAF